VSTLLNYNYLRLTLHTRPMGDTLPIAP